MRVQEGLCVLDALYLVYHDLVVSVILYRCMFCDALLMDLFALFTSSDSI